MSITFWYRVSTSTVQGKFQEHSFSRITNKHTRKKFRISVIVYNHGPYYKMATLPRNSSLHYNAEMFARGYHPQQCMQVAVGNNLPCQGNKLTLKIHLQSGMKGELIVGCFLLKLSTVCSVLLGQSGVNSLSLDAHLDGNALSFLNLSEKTFSGRNSQLGI